MPLTRWDVCATGPLPSWESLWGSEGQWPGFGAALSQPIPFPSLAMGPVVGHTLKLPGHQSFIRGMNLSPGEIWVLGPSGHVAGRSPRREEGLEGFALT